MKIEFSAENQHQHQQNTLLPDDVTIRTIRESGASVGFIPADHQALGYTNDDIWFNNVNLRASTFDALSPPWVLITQSSCMSGS